MAKCEITMWTDGGRKFETIEMASFLAPAIAEGIANGDHDWSVILPKNTYWGHSTMIEYPDGIVRTFEGRAR